ncbi:hypothetical protein [Paremcibacter congregatus]|uniref:PepSY domain-containing protein n=1 Tax=Paremcibacter congregatus TaxID=2043170 RepID=A0A2G4YW13_9PROT|nr:hypothetical protein [Paremcibacter congregatus]PHZ86509.1 hypothetical protein CRD36_01085 [Paremcibacter congregatus]QDE26312.1 hypothetical protein FIV45_02955 [Paremcibacter congregatus]
MGLILIPLSGVLTYADEEPEVYSHHLTAEELKEIRKRSDILALDKIIAHINLGKMDRILEVELLKYSDAFVYEVQILKSNGMVVNSFHDGKTGQHIPQLQED